MKLSNRSKIDSFIVMDVMEQARIEELSGRSIIHMEVGQPGTPAPISAIEALKTTSFITGDGEITQKDSTHPSWKDRIESLKNTDNTIDNQYYINQINPNKRNWKYSRKYNYLQLNPKIKIN